MNGPDNLLEAPLKPAPLPEVRNHTAFPSQYFQMVDVAGQIFHVMVSRLTYTLRKVDAEGCVMLADTQRPLAATDSFSGEPNLSSVLQESDYVPFKPRCDLIFNNALAHAPNGEPRPSWAVGIKVGEWTKRLVVTGPRQFVRDIEGWHLTDPEPVATVPICYENAWGGTCIWPRPQPDGSAVEAQIHTRDARNPIGCGFLDPDWDARAQPDRRPAPRLEPFGLPFDQAAAETGDYPVVGLGALGRWWQPRLALAGSYDEHWKQTRWPGLPEDFDFGYWNCAPEDQQIDYPQGGETVVLAGLHPGGEVRFRLPRPVLKLLLHLDVGVPLFKPLLTDTLIFDFQAYELSVVQRAVVGAAAGVERMELGTWDIEAARRANAAIQKGQ
ncbi:DUF2169 domain-containing protein [Zoogloea sp. 1C4]|uniref:DUF2169 family type VI secretion system accessory protein n=1 Tax=Zoogloea sp. 1C4 TaxID=2570190 RepID=UPI001290E2B3|nr:DUF2169 domain-containing protein [Zoogloea sp. 1C4]